MNYFLFLLCKTASQPQLLQGIKTALNRSNQTILIKVSAAEQPVSFVLLLSHPSCWVQILRETEESFSRTVSVQWHDKLL